MRVSMRYVAVVLACVGTVGAGAVDAGERRHVVKDPFFGEGLYYFFQGRYFSALTNLMTSQYFGRMPHHVDEAELLRGGLLLSYGLHREAGDIFAHVIETGASAPVRDRAWFYLAKIRYQRGYVAEAEDAIRRIQGRLPTELEEEKHLLQANLLMKHGDYQGAVNVLRDMTLGSGTARYVRYNLGVALIKGGDTELGTAVLDELGRSTADTEEFRSLRDKANVALGYAALQHNAPERAVTYLERVRLTGMQADKALLGFGWAKAALKEPKEALVPWSELAGRNMSDAAVLEAKLAVPYALGELGAYGQSLAQYKEAVAAFDQEDVSLDDTIAEIRSGKFLNELVAANPGEEMGWFWNIAKLPDLPHAEHLVPLLAGNEFQEAFKNYRDLRFLAKNLREWHANLGAFRDMLANRRLAYARRLPRVRNEQRAASIANLERRRDSLAGELARAEAQIDVFAFADAKERELGARLDRARAELGRRGADPDRGGARNRYRLVAGALTWRLTQEYPERLWQAKKDLKALDVGLAEAQRSQAALQAAQQQEPARFGQFAVRIDELGKRIDALTPRVAELIGSQQQYVQELAVAELERQKERLAVYRTQAQFAVAQIYDRASRAGDAAHATVP
jgi:hypothetical protein